MSVLCVLLNITLFCVFQIEEYSIAAQNGHIREGDQILQVRVLYFISSNSEPLLQGVGGPLRKQFNFNHPKSTDLC